MLEINDYSLIKQKKFPTDLISDQTKIKGLCFTLTTIKKETHIISFYLVFWYLFVIIFFSIRCSCVTFSLTMRFIRYPSDMLPLWIRFIRCSSSRSSVSVRCIYGVLTVCLRFWSVFFVICKRTKILTTEQKQFLTVCHPFVLYGIV